MASSPFFFKKFVPTFLLSRSKVQFPALVLQPLEFSTGDRKGSFALQFIQIEFYGYVGALPAEGVEHLPTLMLSLSAIHEGVGVPCLDHVHGLLGGCSDDGSCSGGIVISVTSGSLRIQVRMV